jgi:hypothetical protein
VTLRLTELLTAESGWKVVAAAFSEPHDPTMEANPSGPIDGATDAGPLTALLASPAQLQAALAKGTATSVFGTDRGEHAYGDAAARALVKTWSKLALAVEGKPREVHGKGWGFSLAYVNWLKKGDPYPSRMAGLVLGVPDDHGGWSVTAVIELSRPAGQAFAVTKPDGSWNVVLVQYTGQHWSDAGPMRATFAKDAVVLLPNGEQPAADADVASAIAFLNPHADVKAASFDHFTAGGNASMAWFAAELHFTVASSEPGYGVATEKHVVRAIELLDGAAGWKVAVAAFTNVGKLQQSGSSEIADATAPGPLVQLLASPPPLASALDANALVFGTDPDERGVGAGAKKLVGGWNKLQLALDTAQKAREVHTARYGYAMTNVTLGQPGKTKAMNAFVLALPGAAGAWTVIAASYGATF